MEQTISTVGNITSGDDQGGTNNKYGCSAVFLVARKGRLNSNNFLDNEGEGGTDRLYNNFDEFESDNIRNDLFSIFDCKFWIA